MTIAPDKAGTHPLIAQLFSKHGFTGLPAEDVDAFAAKPGHALLVFTEDPIRVRETLDLAVVAPQIVATFPGRFRVGVLLPEAARAVQARYGIRRWPALVILRDGAYVGAIEGLRSWDDYVQELERLLAAAPTRPPSIGVAIKTPGSAAGCNH